MGNGPVCTENAKRAIKGRASSSYDSNPSPSLRATTTTQPEQEMDDEQLRATTASTTQVPLLLGEPVSDRGDDGSAREAEAPLQPKIPQSQVLWRVCSFILVTEFCERLSYYGVGGSLVLLFQSRLNYTNAQADNAYAVWSGLCYCAPLLGGWLADSYLGRFKAIGIFSGIYLVGLLVLIIGVLPRDLTDATGGGAAAARRTTEALVYLGIYTLALGDGGIKPNVSTFGADQFDTRLAEGKRAMESFFNSFYAAINCGALISFTLIVSITQYGLPWLGGTDYRFAVGFSIAALFTAGGIGIFWSGRQRYKMLPPTGSVLAISLGILCQAAGKGLRAWRVRRGWVTAAVREEEDGSTSGSSNSSGSSGGSSSSSSHLPVIASDDESSASPSSSWLDRAKRSQGGSFAAADVEGVKCVCRLLPFLFFLIPYWTCYTQMSTSFQNQGCQMDLSLKPFLPSTKIAVSTLNLFDTLGIVLLVPFFDRIVYPFFHRHGHPLSQLQRFGAGFIFAALAMVTAGLLEIYRKSQAPSETPYPTNSTDTNTISFLEQHISACKNLDDFNPFAYQSWFAAGGSSSSTPPPAACVQIGPSLPDGSLPLSSILCEDVPLVSPVSVFWQVPQFLLIGISEILTSITSYAFFYAQAPPNMRSFAASLNLLTTALGTWLCIPLVALANSGEVEWVPSDVNEGNLAAFFFLLAGIMLCMTAGFVVQARRYRPVVLQSVEGSE